jgi:hypothetical protein
MKCEIGPKKLRKMEILTGRRIKRAFVRGGWSHERAMAVFEDGETSMVDRRTGEVLDVVHPARAEE